MQAEKLEGKTHGSETGSHHAYFVEARLTGDRHAEVVNGVLLSREWTRLPTVQIPATAAIEARWIAVPSIKWPSFAGEHGLMEREAAYAFAVRFQVDSGDQHHGFCAGSAVLCVETRLVEVKCQWSFSITEIGVCKPVSIFETLRYLKSEPRHVILAAEGAGDV